MDKVWGPIDGFYVAAYAAPVADGPHFCSYAKLCLDRPASYWEADCFFKLFGGERHASAAKALEVARLAAEEQLARIPTRDLPSLGFARLNDARQLVFPLAAAIRQRLA